MKYIVILFLLLIQLHGQAAERMLPVHPHYVKDGLKLSSGSGISTRIMLDGYYEKVRRFTQSIDFKNGKSIAYYNAEKTVFYLFISVTGAEVPLVKNGNVKKIKEGLYCQFWPTGGGLPIIIKDKINITHIFINRSEADFSDHYTPKDIENAKKTIVLNGSTGAILRVDIDFKDYVKEDNETLAKASLHISKDAISTPEDLPFGMVPFTMNPAIDMEQEGPYHLRVFSDRSQGSALREKSLNKLFVMYPNNEQLHHEGIEYFLWNKKYDLAQATLEKLKGVLMNRPSTTEPLGRIQIDQSAVNMKSENAADKYYKIQSRRIEEGPIIDKNRAERTEKSPEASQKNQ